MATDSTLARRNLLVIPGALLLFWAVLAIAYAYGVRGDGGSCGDGSQVALGGCREVAAVAAVPILIGAALVVLGFALFRRGGDPLIRAEPGTGTHTAFAVMLSAVVLPLLATVTLAGLQSSRDTSYVLRAWGVDFGVVRLLSLLTIALAVPFLVFILTLWSQSLMRERLTPFLDERLARYSPVEGPDDAEYGENDPFTDVDGNPGSYIDLSDVEEPK